MIVAMQDMADEGQIQQVIEAPGEDGV